MVSVCILLQTWESSTEVLGELTPHEEGPVLADSSGPSAGLLGILETGERWGSCVAGAPETSPVAQFIK